MATLIHSKKSESGSTFRIWSTESDSYITDDMSEKEVRIWARDEAIYQALRSYDMEIDNRIERVLKNGTSSMVEGPRENLKEWDEERSDEDGEE